ncbi:ribonuclease R [Ruminococcus sp.]|uniref:ribonuclease R n=1 Tax=Ruminococcus sp. TaxID=41978 RepID=UPI0025DF025B|nr:ribonuclease R [Ruminococcus sp.]MBQ8967700.1 ribonuclease R [Ruminococcus sp.]
MKQDYRKMILNKLKASGKKPVSFQELVKSFRKGNFNFDKFAETVDKMKKKGEITEGKLGFTLSKGGKLKKCRVTRLHKSFGFVKNVDTGEEIFIPGKRLMGAMPGDVVMVQLRESRGESPEGEVMSIEEENFSRFSGEIVDEFGKLKIMPDVISKYALDFVNPMGLELHEGDKAVAVITKRGERHSEHRCEIVSCLGSSLKAAVCALGIVEAAGLTPVFPAEVIAEARSVSAAGISAEEKEGRLDLRELPIFTIDGADTKDIDDAISVQKTDEGYILGVHIADVSHYVTPRSQLDNEAFNRGTSVYYANRVIPMLPAELSNGICSLNPKEDRLAFTCLAELDKGGNIISYKFAKSVIRSRVKGVYSEINDIFDGFVSRELSEKYAEVMDQLPLMKELAEILMKKRLERGAPQIETSESALMIDEDNVCVGVGEYSRGFAQEMIEDFMLTANECAARFGQENELPFVYRVHEPPSAEKIEGLKELLAGLNIVYVLGDEPKPKQLAEILELSKGTDAEKIINNAVLRSMSKAKYDTEPIGHYGLVLEDYAHFTSPIRRYPDLSIHRIMSAFLDGMTAEECRSRFNKFVYASADRSTETELTAMQTERACDDCYKAEYMAGHVGECYEGVITSVTDFGLFIELDNTCEGLLHVDNMPEGYYESDGMMQLKNFSTGQVYRIGQRIGIKVLGANVNSGKVDFVPAED